MDLHLQLHSDVVSRVFPPLWVKLGTECYKCEPVSVLEMVKKFYMGSHLRSLHTGGILFYFQTVAFVMSTFTPKAILRGEKAM